MPWFGFEAHVRIFKRCTVPPQAGSEKFLSRSEEFPRWGNSSGATRNKARQPAGKEAVKSFAGNKIMDFSGKGCYYKKLNDKELGMPITKETVKYTAHLARIELQPKELEKLSAQLQGILDFIDKLKELDLKDIPPTSHILPINNVLREDDLKASLPSEKTLENAPAKEQSFFVVPKVIE